MNFNDRFYDSYDRIFGRQTRISETGNQFFERFYARFLAADSRVERIFQNTDMARQKAMLKKSLLYCVSFVFNADEVTHMERVAALHDCHHLHIEPDLYDLWLESMVANVREFDPQFDHSVDLAWRLALAPGITFMKYRFDHPLMKDAD